MGSNKFALYTESHPNATMSLKTPFQIYSYLYVYNAFTGTELCEINSARCIEAKQITNRTEHFMHMFGFDVETQCTAMSVSLI